MSSPEEQRRTVRIIALFGVAVLVLGLLAFAAGMAGLPLRRLSYLFVFALGFLSAVLMRRRKA